MVRHAGIRWIELDEEPIQVEAPGGLVYSCRPRIGSAADGAEYFVKGPESEVVIAEHLGYRLAGLVGLPTPVHALVRPFETTGVLFASKRVRTRSGVDQLLLGGVVANSEFVDECAVFDTWIANADRNVNNIVAEPIGARGPASVQLRAIDFEKAHVLRGRDRFSITAMRPGSFRPRETLMAFCGPQPNPAMCARVAAVTNGELARIFRELEPIVGAIAWADASVDFLLSRARRIHVLVREELDA